MGHGRDRERPVMPKVGKAAHLPRAVVLDERRLARPGRDASRSCGFAVNMHGDRFVVHLGARIAVMSSMQRALAQAVRDHCRSAEYTVLDERDQQDGYVLFTLQISDGGEPVQVTFNGEVFSLKVPDGYSWQEFAYRDGDRLGALHDLLRFLDSYADPRTEEVVVEGYLGRRHPELRISNGAVLRRRGWSAGPSEEE